MSQRRWIAYLDGELPPDERQVLEGLLGAPTPEGATARREVAEMQSVWEQVERVGWELAAPSLAPPRLWAGVLARVAGGPAQRAARPSWVPRAALAGAMAGGLALGVGLGAWVTGGRASQPLDLTDYTALVGTPKGSLAELYLAQADAPGAEDDDLPESTGADQGFTAGSDSATEGPGRSTGGGR